MICTSSLVFSSASMTINSENRSSAAPHIPALIGHETKDGQCGLRIRPIVKKRNGLRSVVATVALMLLAMGAFAQAPPPFTFPTYVPVGTTSAPITVTVGSQGA